MLSREEHLEQVKQRALRLLQLDDLWLAFWAFAAGVAEHPETQILAAKCLNMSTMLSGNEIQTRAELWAWMDRIR